MIIKNPTYDDLLRLTLDQKKEIDRLSDKESKNTNIDFYINETTDLICISGFDGFYKEINPSFVKTFGYSKKELLKKPLVDLVHPDDKEKTIFEFEKLSQGIITFNFENRLITKKGKIIVILWTTNINLSEKLVYSFGRNITELKNIQTELIERERLLNDAQKIANLGNWEYYFGSKKMLWSENLYSIYNIQKKNNQNLFKEYLNLFQKDDAAVFLKQIDELKIDKNSFEMIQSITLKNKPIIWVRAVVFPILDKNNILTGLSGTIQDITLQKELEKITLEKKEEESNAKFKLYIENSPDGIIVINENGQFIEVNPRILQITGFNKNELLKKKVGDLAAPDATNISKNHFENLKIHGKANLEIKIWNKKKQEIWISIDALKLSETRFISYIRDITERKILLDKIQKKENRFRALLENNEEVISLIDENANTFFRNAAAARITGWENKDFQTVASIDYIHPDYLETVQSTIKKALENPNVSFPILIQIKHKLGHYIWMEGKINNKLNDKDINGIVVNMRDVTESKLAVEQLNDERNKFSKIAQTSPGLIYSMRQNKDKSLSYPYASSAIKKIYGFEYSEIENNPNKIFELIHPDDITTVYESITRTKTKLVPLKEIYRYYHPTLGLVWHEVNSLPVVEPEGTVICHGIVSDITERIKSEQKILKTSRLFAFISQINQMIVRTKDEQTLFHEACNIALEFGKFKMAWIGIINEKTEEVTLKMIAGDEESHSYLTTKKISENTKITNNEIIERVIKESKYYYCNDIEKDSKLLLFNEGTLERSFASMGVFPIIKFNKVIGFFTFYSDEKNFFDESEIALLEEATGDVSFALENFDKEESREKAEKLLKESEYRYHTLAESSTVGIFRANEIGETTYVNPMYLQISGHTFQDSLGFGWAKAVHPEDRGNILLKWKIQAKEKKEIILSEYRFVRPDNTIVWVIGKAMPEKNINGEVIGYIGSITDITDRKIYEDIIKKEKQLSEDIIKNLPGLCYLYNREGKFIKWNKNLELITGYNSNELEKLNIIDLYDDDQKDIIKKSVESVYIENQLGIEVEIFNKNKTKIPFYINSLIIDYEGIKCVLGIGVDLTERKKAEEQFLTVYKKLDVIINALPDLLFEIGINGYIHNIHTQREDLLIIPTQEIISKNLNDILSKNAAEICMKAIHEANEFGFSKGHQYAVELPNGVHWFELSISKMKVESENQNHFICLSRDVTEKKNMELELIKAKDKAELASKAKTEFLANMSHEIRTPLNGIIGFTELLMETNLKKKEHQYLSTINESANSLLDIVNDILDFSKIESGKLQLNPENLNINKLLNQIFNLFKYQAINKEIDLSIDIDENLPEFIFVDSVRLKQILVNLLNNAIKFTDKGEVKLQVKKLPSTNDGFVKLMFSIKDTGIGIKLKNNKKIFDSFVQVDNSSNRKFGGTGLGLAITNNLLSLMNSKLELKSIYGNGSDFYFTLEFKINYNQNIQKTENNFIPDSDIATQFSHFANNSVLIVEDNKINTLLIKTILKKIITNVTIFEATDGNEAVEKFKQENIDIILMDIQMPNKNGYEATKEIRNIEKGDKIPIVALTAGIMEGDKGKCLEAGMNDYLAKPIIKSDLEKILLKWLISK